MLFYKRYFSASDYIFALILLLLFGSCNQRKDRHQEQLLHPISSIDSVRFAKGFSIETYDDYTVVKIVNPWNTNKILRRFILIPKSGKLPENLPEGEVVRTPVSRTVSFGAVHCSFLAEIGAIETLAGVCESHFINNPAIREMVADGRIVDVGTAANPDVEQLMMLQPEALLTAPLNEEAVGNMSIVGATIIEGLDYMEHTPLGRAEWLRFYALFFDKRALADSLFAHTVANYRAIQNQTAKQLPRPTVFSETVYNGVWWMPGGNSYMAHLIYDAGGDYIFKDDRHTGSIGLSFETVLEKAAKCDFWLIKYNSPYDLTLEQLAAENPNYSLFDAFKKEKIYAVNTGKTSYYEDLPIHPDRILEDLAGLFHNFTKQSGTEYFIKIAPF